MQKFFLTFFFILTVQFLNAQIRGITETGNEVILNEDGTWKYLNDSTIVSSKIQVNDKTFLKDKYSTFLVKSTKLNVGIWIDPKKWSFTKGTGNDAFEFNFHLKGNDLYAMLISEKTPIPLETLKGIAIETARKAAPDIKIKKEEYRNVNGIQVLLMQMSGTIKGVKFTYYGYYYSNSNGTIQFLTYSGENTFKNYLNEIELFINGLVELK
jgi:hypothetical protein